MRHQFTIKACVMATVAAGMLGGAAWSSTQPQRSHEPGARPEIPVEQLQAKLAERLESVKAQQAAIEKALARLAAGDEPLEVFKEVEPMLDRRSDRRSGRRPGWGERRRPGPGGPRRGDTSSLDPATVKQLRELVADKLPGLARTLKAAEQDDPERAKRLLARMAPQLQWVIESTKRDPELAKLRLHEIQAGINVMTTIKELRDAMAKSDQNADEIHDWRDMTSLALAAHFDSRLRVEEHEIKGRRMRVDARLDEMRQNAIDRDSHIDQMVDQIFRRIQRARLAEPEETHGDD